jgi:hypothetical protein
MRGAGLVVETTTTMKVAPTASNTGGAGKGEEESALVLQLRRAKVVLSESSSRRYMPPEWCEKRLLLEPVLINVYQTFIKTIVSPRQARDKHTVGKVETNALRLRFLLQVSRTTTERTVWLGCAL